MPVLAGLVRVLDPATGQSCIPAECLTCTFAVLAVDLHAVLMPLQESIQRLGIDIARARQARSSPAKRDQPRVTSRARARRYGTAVAIVSVRRAEVPDRACLASYAVVRGAHPVTGIQTFSATTMQEVPIAGQMGVVLPHNQWKADDIEQQETQACSCNVRVEGFGASRVVRHE